MLKRCLVLVSVLVSCASLARAITVSVSGANASPGDSVDVCVDVPDNDGQISGVQMDMNWDASCLAVDTTGGDEAACNVNPDANRTTFRTKASSSTLRVIMLNIADTTPIAANVQRMFCCQFRVSPNAGGRVCPISLVNVIASDPKGTRLSVNPRPGTVAVEAGRPSDQPLGNQGPGNLPGGAMMPAITGGNVQAPAGGGGNTGTTSGSGAAGSGAGSGTGTTSGSGAAPVAPKGLPSGPGGAGLPQVPGVPEVPAAPVPGATGMPSAADVIPTVQAAVPTLRTTPAAVTPGKTQTAGTPKSTPKETAKAVGTPTAGAMKTGTAGTPTPK